MKTVAIIQARMNSTRLPGKMLMDLAGKPLLERVIERVESAKVFDDILVATSDGEADNLLAEFCHKRGTAMFRGSLNDVLDRFVRAAESIHADVIARLTGDCPLLDPTVIRAAVTMFHEGDFDYVSNAIERTYPDGLDTEVFGIAALRAADEEASLPSEREHVTPFIWKNTERFRQGYLKHDADLSALRWTVDEPQDLEFVRAVYDRLGDGCFGMDAILALLEKEPALQQINAGILMNEGLQKSLEEDEKFLSDAV